MEFAKHDRAISASSSSHLQQLSGADGQPSARPSDDSTHPPSLRAGRPDASTSFLSPLPPVQGVSAFRLPNLPQGRNSASSLMDAVFGDSATHHSALPSPASGATAIRAPGPSNPALAPQPNRFASPVGPTPLSSTTHPLRYRRWAKGKDSENTPSRSPSTRSGRTEETESWDVLSEADSRLNEGEEKKDDEAVRELQKKVDRRKSTLPHLESELAQLEAQIRAAEERLAKAQIAQQDRPKA